MQLTLEKYETEWDIRKQGLEAQCVGSNGKREANWSRVFNLCLLIPVKVKVEPRHTRRGVSPEPSTEVWAQAGNPEELSVDLGSAAETYLEKTFLLLAHCYMQFVALERFASALPVFNLF